MKKKTSLSWKSLSSSITLKKKKSRVYSMDKKLQFMPYLSRDSNLGITIQERLLSFH
jgi:hypothetical protein